MGIVVVGTLLAASNACLATLYSIPFMRSRYPKTAQMIMNPSAAPYIIGLLMSAVSRSVISLARSSIVLACIFGESIFLYAWAFSPIMWMLYAAPY